MMFLVITIISIIGASINIFASNGTSANSSNLDTSNSTAGINISDDQVKTLTKFVFGDKAEEIISRMIYRVTTVVDFQGLMNFSDYNQPMSIIVPQEAQM